MYRQRSCLHADENKQITGQQATALADATVCARADWPPAWLYVRAAATYQCSCPGG